MGILKKLNALGSFITAAAAPPKNVTATEKEYVIITLERRVDLGRTVLVLPFFISIL